MDGARLLHTLVVGLGRAGAGLHLRVLAKMRAKADGLLSTGPVVACDPEPAEMPSDPRVQLVDTPAAAAELVPPAETVVHVCTPPVGRVGLLTELADLGFRRLIVEKPLAADAQEHARIERLRDERGMRIAVVAHWLDSPLTERLRALIASGSLGRLRSLSFAQHKPRFGRSLTTAGHPTAFDVEVPHSLGVALDLAGPGELAAAESADMAVGHARLPRMGAATVVLHHRGGVTTEIRSDLTAPVRQRRVALEFTGGRATGHYPVSEQDDHAQLSTGDGRAEVFRDDALTAFVARTYRRFRESGGDDRFALHGDVVRLIAEAKSRSAPAGTCAGEG